MRIALLAPTTWGTPPQHDAPRAQVVALLHQGLTAQGVDVTLFTSGEAEDNPPHDSPHLAYLSTRAIEFDLIHNHGGVLPVAYSHVLPTPMVSTLYSPPPLALLPLYQQHADRQYYVATNRADCDPTLRYMAVVPPGLDPASYTYHESPGTYLVFLGELSAHGGATDALRIAQQYGMRLVLAGPIQDQAYYATQIAPHVDKGQAGYADLPVQQAEYKALLGGAYALLQPHDGGEADRFHALAAMACGTPVVAWATDAMGELVRDGDTGYLVRGAMEAVTRLGHVSQLRRQRCRQWVEERFTPSRMVQEYIQVYQQILEQEKPRAHHATPPWGRWEVLLDTPAYKVKRLTVSAGQRLSYQKHFQRAEHWTIVQGQALVTLNATQIPLHAGDVVNIPRQAWHRIANVGSDDVVFIEVQEGDYFGEDDIVRLHDDTRTIETLLHIDGAVQAPCSFSFADLARLPGQVPDVGRLLPGREGGGVWLRALLDTASVSAPATHVFLTAADGTFSACVPLAAVVDKAVLVYRLGSTPLHSEQGGPVRFFLTDVEGCATDDAISTCANVKGLGLIRLTTEPVADSRMAKPRP